jgi:hypothetical protein
MYIFIICETIYHSTNIEKEKTYALVKLSAKPKYAVMHAVYALKLHQ